MLTDSAPQNTAQQQQDAGAAGGSGAGGGGEGNLHGCGKLPVTTSLRGVGEDTARIVSRLAGIDAGTGALLHQLSGPLL